MRAIIVPGVTDLNKGDQALVWESHRLAKDSGLYREILILNSGDTFEERELLCRQSIDNGFTMIENILRHPRRGVHRKTEHINESKVELLKQVKNAGLDFLSTKLLLSVCGNLKLVRALFSSTVYDTVKSFSEADTIFVKGGGFIHAYGEKTAPYLMWYFLFYVRLALKLKKKVVFLPNSYGPFEGLTVKEQVKSVFNNLDLIYAREYVSQESLSTLLNRSVPLEMDLGFFLQKGSEKDAVEILTKYGLSKQDKVIGVTIRPWRFPGMKNPEALYRKYILSVIELTNHMLNLGYKVALCNQSLGPNAHEDDRNAINDVYSQIEHSNLVWINENLTCETLKAIYSNFYFFVGTRFHSIIFSLTSFVPSIAIGYGGNKAKGIMGDFNLNQYVVQIHEIEGDELIRMFDSAIDNYSDIVGKLKSKIGLVAESRNRMIEDIQALYK